MDTDATFQLPELQGLPIGAGRKAVWGIEKVYDFVYNWKGKSGSRSKERPPDLYLSASAFFVIMKQ